MGYKDKAKYQKDLHQQAYDKLIKMQAFGESKKEAISQGTSKDKIFSFNTYRTYWQHIKYFLKYIKENYPECTNLKMARVHVNEWLSLRAEQGLSAWTVQTEAKALGKLYGIEKDDPDYFDPPKRHREDIKRSRGLKTRDKHFSTTNNDEFIRFCKGVGARREGMEKMRGNDLLTLEQIKNQLTELEKTSKSRQLTDEEEVQLTIRKDALLFSDVDFFVWLREKGGRERIAPIVGPDEKMIVERFRSTKPDARVWEYVSKNADIHSYRADYSNFIYRKYARDIKDIPYDRINKGTGRAYQSGAYHCRKDECGKTLDRLAMLLASKALGHNRIEIVAENYIRGI